MLENITLKALSNVCARCMKLLKNVCLHEALYPCIITCIG